MDVALTECFALAFEALNQPFLDMPSAVLQEVPVNPCDGIPDTVELSRLVVPPCL